MFRHARYRTTYPSGCYLLPPSSDDGYFGSAQTSSLCSVRLGNQPLSNLQRARLVADAPGNAEAESKEREEAALLALNRRQSGTTNPDAARRPFKREATFSADGRK